MCCVQTRTPLSFQHQGIGVQTPALVPASKPVKRNRKGSLCVYVCGVVLLAVQETPPSFLSLHFCSTSGEAVLVLAKLS